MLRVSSFRFALVLLLLALLLPTMITPTASGRGTTGFIPPQKPVVGLAGTGQLLSIGATSFQAQVGADGRFNMGVQDASGQWDLSYRWPGDPSTSITSLRIDGVDYVYGTDGTNTVAPSDIDALTNRSTWWIGDVEVTQDVQIIQDAQGNPTDAARISYQIHNIGSVAHTVGTRVMIDTEINTNDGAPFRVPGDGIITSEREYSGSAIPDFFQVFSTIEDSLHVAAGTLRDGTTLPDRFVIAAWPGIRSTAYDYTINPAMSITNDSAYAVYWNPADLAPGETRTVSTIYGLSTFNADLRPPLALAVSAPQRLSVVGYQYGGNPFSVIGTLLNNGTATAENVQVTLDLTQSPELQLAAGSSATQIIGQLTVGAQTQVSWSVQATPQTTARTVAYSVHATADATDPKTVTVSTILPDLQLPVRVRILDATGQPVHTLALNADGWPVLNADGGAVANPLTIEMSADVIAGADSVSMSIGSVGGNPFVVSARPVGCQSFTSQQADTGNPYAMAFVYDTCSLQNRSGTFTASWKVWLHPWDTNAFQVVATLFGPYGDTRLGTSIEHVQVPTAQVRPLILIPGTTGSVMYDQATQKNVWPGLRVGTSFDRMSLFTHTIAQMSPRPDIVPTDVVRDFYGPIYQPLINSLQQVGYSEYQVNNDPSRRTQAGCQAQQQGSHRPLLFVFAYDWRLDNASHVASLDDYIACIRSFYPASKIDIVAHSQGGLIARRYVLDRPGQIAKVVSIATPWLGAVKVINTFETGDFLDSYQHMVSITKDTLKALVGSFPSVGQLAPSAAYYDLLDRSATRPLVEDGQDWNGNYATNNIFTSTELVNVLDRRYGGDEYALGTAGQRFHAYRNSAGDQQDDWRNDTTGVTYYQIYGVKPGDDTIDGVRASTKISCTLGMFNCHSIPLLTTHNGRGDGTVPLISAARVGNGLDYAPNVADRYLVKTGICDHAGMLGNPEVTNKVNRYLTGIDWVAGSDVMHAASVAPALAGASLLAGDAPVELHYVTLIGVADVQVMDSLGNTTDPTVGTGVSPPDVHIDQLGDSASEAIFPITGSYTITFRLQGTLATVDAHRGTGDSTSRAVRYVDMELPADVVGTIRVGPQGVEQLMADTNGDGVPETIIAPTVDLSGVAAADTTPPEVTMRAETLRPGQQRVTLSATDASGVRELRYSLDGSMFLAYTNPFTVYAGQSLTVFADDNAANRTSPIIYPLAQSGGTVFLPMVRR